MGFLFLLGLLTGGAGSSRDLPGGGSPPGASSSPLSFLYRRAILRVSSLYLLRTLPISPARRVFIFFFFFFFSGSSPSGAGSGGGGGAWVGNAATAAGCGTRAGGAARSYPSGL